MAKLAVNGGPRTIKGTIGKKWPIFGKREEKELLAVLHSGSWWRGGFADETKSKVWQFEEAWAKYQDAKYCVAVTNGTQAIECALKSAGVEAGDEVLVPALTFVASATAIALVNAVPVFVDVDANSFNIDPDAMAAAITPRTRAAVIVHNGGYPADMDRIMRLARKHDLRIVEDSAHAHGSEWKKRRIGAIGDLGTFSFQMGKTLTCGEGGAVVTDNEELAELAFSFHHIGRMKGRPFYEFHRVASNLRLTEWQAGVLLAQMTRLDAQIERGEANAMYLADGMKDIPGVEPIRRDKRVTRWGFYYWNFHYRADRFGGIPRDRWLEAMRAEGVPVQTGAHGEPIYRNPLFRSMNFGRTGCPIRCPLHRAKVDYTKTCCPEAERLFKDDACAIMHTHFLGPRSDMDKILRAMRKLRDHADELRD